MVFGAAEGFDPEVVADDPLEVAVGRLNRWAESKSELRALRYNRSMAWTVMIDESGNDDKSVILAMSPAPLGQIEPHAQLLNLPAPGQRLYKLMSVENLIRSIKGGYLHFNRVDRYKDFPLADADDGAELPLDNFSNQTVTFEKAPTFSLSDYYAHSRGRTYACCFSLENSDHIWCNYGCGSLMGQVGLELDFEKLRHRVNAGLAGDAGLMYGDLRCHQIFSINYGEVTYVDRDTHRANTERAANPIEYAYLKDARFADERELRVTLSAIGMGRFLLANGREIDFSPALQLAFDFRGAIADGTITEVLTGATTNVEHLTAELARLGIGPVS
jgi:hypothetical protein